MSKGLEPKIEDSRIREWERVGLVSPERVLQRLDEEINEYIIFVDSEHAALRKNFDSVCIVDSNGTKYWDESIFVNFLACSVPSFAAALVEAGPILYASALHLGSFPFKINASCFLTYEDILRFLFWILPECAARLMGGALTSNNEGDTIIVRVRTVVDQRRLLFQSLAEPSAEIQIFNTEEEKKIAAQKANEVPESQLCYATTNYDRDGDEMYHDILDVLSATQPVKRPHASVSRDDFRPLAKRLHDSQTSLRQLAIERERFKSLVKLLLTERFNGSSAGLIQLTQLEKTADNVVNAFSQESNGEITWQKFEEAVTRVAPYIFSSFYRILSSLLTVTVPEVPNNHFLSQPDIILTRPVLIQLGFLLSETISFDELHLHYQSISSLSTNEHRVSEMVTAIKNSGFSLLLFSGKSLSTGQLVVFGGFFPSPVQDEKEILDPEQSYWERSLLFQLAPVYDVFRSRVGNPAWTQTGQEVWFGENGKAVAVGLIDGLRKGKISHIVEGEYGTYEATNWRGDWGLEFEIENIEVWGE